MNLYLNEKNQFLVNFKNILTTDKKIIFDNFFIKIFIKKLFIINQSIFSFTIINIDKKIKKFLKNKNEKTKII
jgi:hypothetical protein